MKQYTVEHVAALLEKAAAEIESKNLEIEELKKQLEQQTIESDQYFTKTASFEDNSSNVEFENSFENWGSLGEPSTVNAPTRDAKANLENFLNSLA